MKGFLRPKPYLTLAAFLMIAVAVVIPIAGHLLYPHLAHAASPHPSDTVNRRPPVKLPLAKGQQSTTATTTNITITSTTGWQQTGLTVQQGTQ